MLPISFIIHIIIFSDSRWFNIGRPTIHLVQVRTCFTATLWNNAKELNSAGLPLCARRQTVDVDERTQQLKIHLQEQESVVQQ